MAKTRMTWLLLTTGAGAALLGLTPGAGATGTIDTTGATLTTGSAPAQGSVTTDAAADLGAVPSIDDMVSSDGLPVGPNPGSFDRQHFSGLGGPNFHATADVTLPAGTHDFGRFEIDAGVTVTVAGRATIRAAGDVVIEGRLEFSAPMNCFIECGKGLTLTGRNSDVTTGIYAPEGDAWIYIAVHGALDVSADEGARVELGATDDPYSNVEMYVSCAAEGVQHVRSATLDGVGFETAGGLALHDCDGNRRTHLTAFGADGLTLDGGTFDIASVSAKGDVVVDGATVGGLSVETNGGVQLLHGAQVGATSGTSIECRGDVTTGTDGAIVGPGLNVFCHSGRVVLGPATDVQATTGIQVEAWDGVELSGSITTTGDWLQLVGYRGDVVLHDGASLGGSSSFTELWAQGSVVAEGGAGTFTARNFDIRAVTGDLDLDVGSMTTSDGSFVALTNGTVKLRGSYTASRNVQILSRLDSIDVAGAGLQTADAGSAMSGFVRLATYSSTADVNASGATLATGDSDGMSGDVLLQIAESGGAQAQAKLTVTHADAVRTPDGVTTRIKGTISTTRPGIDLNGAGSFEGGTVARRVFLRRRGAQFRGAADGVDVAMTRVSGRRATFVLTIREPGATPGEQAAVAFDRAGLHARGRFRRPRAK